MRPIQNCEVTPIVIINGLEGRIDFAGNFVLVSPARLEILPSKMFTNFLGSRVALGRVLVYSQKRIWIGLFLTEPPALDRRNPLHSPIE